MNRWRKFQDNHMIKILLKAMSFKLSIVNHLQFDNIHRRVGVFAFSLLRTREKKNVTGEGEKTFCMFIEEQQRNRSVSN